MAYIIVQHLHPEYESALPEILQRESSIPVVEITDNVQVEPDFIYVIPANKLLTASGGILQLSARSDQKKTLSIDLFFSSLAEVHRSQSIGVLLSGTGTDGTNGLEDIKNYGGVTIAQSSETAAYEGMPKNAIDAGIVDFVLPPGEIVAKLLELQQAFQNHDPANKSDLDKISEDGFRSVLGLLRARIGVDFNFYKQTTIRRRIIRRMMILKLKSILEYHHHLKNDAHEMDLLFQDLLIQVTSFFRDPKTYDVLCNKVLPEIIKNNSGDNTLRIWIPGCASGQEAYTIAICLSEFLSNHAIAARVKIFGTDLSEKSISKARTGIYSKAETEGLSDKVLNQYFIKTDSQYQLIKDIRDMCIFAVHNFLTDPPFAKMNLISCRNVLIYFEPFLQKKALNLFHYALNEKGFLLLGKSESVGIVSELFSVFDKKNKFFTRKHAPGRFMNVISRHNETAYANKNYIFRGKDDKADDYQKSADDILLSKYTPAGVVVNDQFDILQFRGLTGDYLEAPPGKATLNVLKMAREGLGFEIRNALQKAKSSGEPFIKNGLPLQKGKKLISVEVIPILDTIDLHYLILFRDEMPPNGLRDADDEESGGHTRAGQKPKNKKDEQDTRIDQLEKELAQARKDMLKITEEQEAANEELQSSNEELLSGSEELQSLNEELETSKEELQSTNEELITINQELYDRIDQLNQARRFSDSIIAILHEPLLVLDKHFQIKRANRAFYTIFNLTEEKTLGKVLFDLQENAWDIPQLRQALDRIMRQKREMIDLEVAHTLPVIGNRDIIFNLQAMENEGVELYILLALNDVTERKNAEKLRLMAKNLEQNMEMLNNLYLNSPAFVCTLLGPKHIFDLVNPAYQKLFGERKLTGKPILAALPELKAQGFNELLDTVYEKGEVYVATEQLAWVAYDEGLPPAERYFNFSYQPMHDAHKKISGVLCFGYEVTKEVLAKKKGEADLRLILNSLPQLTFTASSEGTIHFFNKSALDYGAMTIEAATTENGWETIIHPDELQSVITLAENCLKTGEDFYKEIRLKRGSDNSYRWHLMRATRIEVGSGDGLTAWVGMGTDIHEQKMSEQKKDEFINIASHEMKTPLAATKGYLQLLEMSLDHDTEPAHFVAKALASANRLNHLINELLELGKTQNGDLKYNISVFDFDKMLTDTIEDVQKASPDYEIVKKGKIAGEIKGDKERLQQVLMNLLGNAIKYSPDKKKIEATVKEKDGSLIFSVKDQGIGISKENLDHIFKRYFRVENQAMQFQGMGIGLFISNEFIKRHGGRMWVESKPAKGSTFYFSIPLH
jgi:two-component system CheB/CheR fusion protein